MKHLFFNSLLVFCLLSSSSSLFAQQRTITGSVTTLERIAVANAEVKVLSSDVIVLTDSAGRFTVECLPKDKIKVSAKGFKSAKLRIDAQTKEAAIDLTFTPTEKKVEQAVGYGYIKEEDKSYAIESIRSNQAMNFSQYTSMIDVIVNSSTSVSYGNGGFIVRGEGSLLSANQALIIIDGNPANMNQLNAMSPMDVKSVDVLKGASASMYGSRGANGVIIINTKKRPEDL